MRHSGNIDPAISNLERQLRSLKLEEKKYNKLAKKLQEIERNSQTQLAKGTPNEQNDQLQQQELIRLKEQIDKCIVETQALQQQYHDIDEQIVQSHKQIGSLELMLQKLQGTNSSKRQQIKQKGDLYNERKNRLQAIHLERDKIQTQIDLMKESVTALAEQECKLKREAEAFQYQCQQQKNVKKHLLQFLSKMEGEKNAYVFNVRELDSLVQMENNKFMNLKEEIATLREEEAQLMDELREKQDKYQGLNENSIRNKSRVEELDREMREVDRDLRLLSEEFVKEGNYLALQEKRNRELNDKFDNLSRDAEEVWQSLKQLLQVANGHCSDQGYEDLEQIRRQAFEAWSQLQGLMS